MYVSIALNSIVHACGINYDLVLVCYANSNYITSLNSLWTSELYVAIPVNTCASWFQALKWPSPPWPWQVGQLPLWVSPGQTATPSANSDTSHTLSSFQPGTAYRIEQTVRGQRSWGSLLLGILVNIGIRRGYSPLYSARALCMHPMLTPVYIFMHTISIK